MYETILNEVFPKYHSGFTPSQLYSRYPITGYSVILSWKIRSFCGVVRSADTLTGRTMCTLNNGTDVPVGTDFLEGPCTRCSCTQNGKECTSILCPPIGCTPGREFVTRPGECCPTCGPRKKPTPCSNALTSIMTCRIVLHATLLPNDIRQIGLTSYHVELYCTYSIYKCTNIHCSFFQYCHNVPCAHSRP